MATTPLERLLFLQGGQCFFCKQPLAKAEASVEHLQAVAKGGTNHDDNCVACCKSLNHALGSMSLKAKIEVFLNQKGDFRCPNGTQPAPTPKTKPAAKAAAPKAPVKKAAAPKTSDVLEYIIKNLKQRGKSRPIKEKTLTSTVAALLKHQKSSESAASIIAKLVESGKCTIVDKKVTYAL